MSGSHTDTQFLGASFWQPLVGSTVPDTGLRHFEGMEADQSTAEARPVDLHAELHTLKARSPAPRNRAVPLDRAVPAALLPKGASFERRHAGKRLAMLSVSATVATISLAFLVLV